MATIIERDVHRDGDSSASTMLIGVIAIALIIGMGFFMYNFLPMTENGTGTRGTIDVNVTDKTPPATNP